MAGLLDSAPLQKMVTRTGEIIFFIISTFQLGELNWDPGIQNFELSSLYHRSSILSVPRDPECIKV